MFKQELLSAACLILTETLLFIFFFGNMPAPDQVCLVNGRQKSCDLLLASMCVFGFSVSGVVYFNYDDQETTLMITTIPPVGILIDLPFGVLMWTSIAHFLLTLVMKEDSSFIILRVLRGVNSPIHRAINLLKPSFIITRLALLYCALALFILRYYILPLLIGFDVWNFYDMPLESLLLSAKTDLGF